MERIQIINELRSYCHPTWFHKILKWKTEALKKLLNFYKEEEAPKDEYEITIKKVKKVGEILKNKMEL